VEAHVKREVTIMVAITDEATSETLGVAYSRVRIPDELMTRMDPDRGQDWYLETVKITATAAYRDAFDTRAMMMELGPDGKPTVKILPTEGRP
jgi:hypothetical protein